MKLHLNLIIAEQVPFDSRSFASCSFISFHVDHNNNNNNNNMEYVVPKSENVRKIQ